MKFEGIFILGVFLIVITGAVLADSELVFHGEVSSYTLETGDELTLYISFDGSTKIGSLDMEIEYPSDILSVVSVTALKDNIMMQANIKNNPIKVSLISLSGVPPGKFLAIKFKAEQRGNGKITLRVLDVTDPEAHPLQFLISTRNLEIRVITPTSGTETGSPSTSTPALTTTSTSTPSHTSNQSFSTSSSISSKTTTTRTTSTTTSTKEKTSKTSSSSPTQIISTTSQQQNRTSTTSSSSYPSANSSIIFIVSNPSGANVYLNGQHLGKTPLQIEVPKGKYNITVKYGNTSITKKIDISKGGERLKVSFNFAKNNSYSPTESSNSDESKRGICGPGSIVVLAILIALQLIIKSSDKK